MKKIYSFILSIGIVSILLSGCVTKQKYLELDKQYKDCISEKQFANSELADMQNKNKDYEKEIGSLKNKVNALISDTLTLASQLRQSERDYAQVKHDYDNLAKDISKLSSSTSATISQLSSSLEEREQMLQRKQDSLLAYSKNLAELQEILNQKDAEVRLLKEKVSQALQNFEGSGLKVAQRNGKVYVSMDEKLLFASGKWEVQAEGRNALQNLAQVLESDSTINILIEGHTDNVRFNGSGQVKDNWDLSVMRATSVVKIILESGNVNPQRISASGRGEFFPIDTTDTPEARALNRRTEIILTPKLDELFQLIDAN